jgi:phosphoglycolate phosphatase-like HAD superfamily hydrolase
MSQPNIPGTLALDFDGVLCDGMQEYFQTSWRTYRTYSQIWPTSSAQPPANLEASFRLLRPVVTSGWEMPVLLRAIIKGFAEPDILQRWPTIRDRVVAEEDLNAQELAKRVDLVRDRWIAEDLESWLGLHRFYPGVISQLQSWLGSGPAIVIITTKESRFVQQLLQQQNIHLSSECIFGKDRQLSKTRTLQQLLASATLPIWFVEDLLPTLIKVQQEPQLETVGLFLADWGYNIARDRTAATQDERIQLLSLTQFSQEFTAWI